MRYLILVAPLRTFPRGYSDGNWLKVCIIRLLERKSHNGWNVSARLQHMHGIYWLGLSVERARSTTQSPVDNRKYSDGKILTGYCPLMTRAIEWKQLFFRIRPREFGSR